MAIADGKVSLKHLVTMETLTNEEVLGLIRRGGDFKNGRADFQLDRQYFAANLFFENSTRTHKSFEVAEKKRNITEIFNLAAEPIQMKAFVNEIAARLNKKIIPFRIPAFLLRTIFQANSKIFRSKKVYKISETVGKWLLMNASGL